MSNLKQANQQLQSQYFNKKSNSVISDLSNYKISNKITYSNLDVSNFSTGILPDERNITVVENDILQNITEENTPTFQEPSCSEEQDPNSILQNLYKSQTMQTDLDNELIYYLKEYLRLCGEDCSFEAVNKVDKYEMCNDNTVSTPSNDMEIGILQQVQLNEARDWELTDDKLSSHNSVNHEQIQVLIEQNKPSQPQMQYLDTSSNIVQTEVDNKKEELNEPPIIKQTKSFKTLSMGQVFKQQTKQVQQQKKTTEVKPTQNTQTRVINKPAYSSPRKQTSPSKPVATSPKSEDLTLTQLKQSPAQQQKTNISNQRNKVAIQNLTSSYVNLMKEKQACPQQKSKFNEHSIKFYKKNEVPFTPNQNIVLSQKQKEQYQQQSKLLVIDHGAGKNDVPSTNKQIMVHVPRNSQIESSQ